MQSTFATVVWVVCGVGLVVGFVALVSSGKAWDDYGKNRLLLDSDASRAPSRGPAAALLERDTEIRELLEARNARRVRAGKPPLDVDAEIAREIASLSEL